MRASMLHIAGLAHANENLDARLSIFPDVPVHPIDRLPACCQSNLENAGYLFLWPIIHAGRHHHNINSPPKMSIAPLVFPRRLLLPSLFNRQEFNSALPCAIWPLPVVQSLPGTWGAHLHCFLVN